MTKKIWRGEERELKDFAESLGYTAELSNGGHLKFTHPKVPKPVFASSSPSCQFARKRARGQLLKFLRLAESGSGENNKEKAGDARGRHKPHPPYPRGVRPQGEAGTIAYFSEGK